MNNEELLKLFKEAKELVESESLRIEQEKEQLSPTTYLEKTSYAKGKLDVINAFIKAFGNKDKEL